MTTENDNDEEKSMAGSEASATASPPKQPSHNERVQNIIEKGSPEELEAEVRSSQQFLANLKTPMAGMVSFNRDAQHWIQQIGKYFCSCWLAKDTNGGTHCSRFQCSNLVWDNEY